MSKLSIKFSLLAISCFALIVALDLMGQAIRPSVQVTEPDKVEQHRLVQEEIFRILSMNGAFTYRHFPQYRVDTIGSSGIDNVETIYLPIKYENSSYSVQLTAKGNAMQTTTLVYAAFSDSAFNVYCDSNNVIFSWFTIGAR